MNTDWIKAVRGRMRAIGMTQEQLAQKLGVSQGGIGHWLNGRREPTVEIINNMLLAVGLPALSVLNTDHPSSSGAIMAPENWTQNVAMVSAERLRKYPLMEWTHAIEPHKGLGYAGQELIDSEVDAGSSGFWLEVKGGSMQPSFVAGARILIRCEGFSLVSGKLYIAKLATGEVVFRQYQRDGGLDYLVPLNPAFPMIEATGEVQIVGQVVDGRLPPMLF
jgi:SOS-response transcriptional repressor LexA